MSDLIERTLKTLEERRERVLNGYVNCIPSPFKRFSNDFIGIEQSCFYVVSSFTKGGKSQFTSYTFIYKPLMTCYYANSDISLKILYFPLEETPERILQRFICWLLYDLTKGEIRISPRDLRSTTNAVSKDILDLLNTDKIQSILKYFTDHVIFPKEAGNPTGIYKYCVKYAEEHGTTHRKKITIKNEFGNSEEINTFDSYEQDNPNEYRLIIIDTINLIDTERGLSLKQSIDKMSEYLAKYLRNRYHYSPVVIQQQAFDGENNDSFKLGKVRPSVAGLGDSKYTSRDANVVLGLFSPYRFGIPEYKGYDITKFKDNIRFLEVCVSRDGEMGGICPLFFDGAVCNFQELPKPTDRGSLQEVYKYLLKIRKQTVVNMINSDEITGKGTIKINKSFIRNKLMKLFH